MHQKHDWLILRKEKNAEIEESGTNSPKFFACIYNMNVKKTKTFQPIMLLFAVLVANLRSMVRKNRKKQSYKL